MARDESRSAPARDLDVVGIGSMVVDRMHRAPRILGGDEKGLLRAAPSGSIVEAHVGGVILNHLGWAAALGLRCGIFGRQGDDEDGRFLRAAMDRAGIARDILLVPEASSLAEIFVDDEGGRAIYMAPGATSDTTAEQIRSRHAPFVARAARLTTEVSQLPLAAAREALRVATEAGVDTLVDLDVPPSDALRTLGSEAELEDVLRAARVLKPSKSAAMELHTQSGATAIELARALRARFGNDAVVITDGARGCALSTLGFEGELAACPVEVVDTTGAGDAFLGGLLAGLAHGLDWPTAGALANAAGAACCEQLGAFPADAAAARTRVLALYAGPPLALRETAARGAGTATAAPARAARATLEAVRDGLVELCGRSHESAYAEACDLIESCGATGGRVHTLGVGKPGHIARYAAALLASTGTPAAVLDALEVPHGSAGQVVRGDVVIAISHSGETPELLRAVGLVQERGARLVAIVGALDSTLARRAGCVLDAGVEREGGPLGLAPRASTAAEVAVVAALAAELQARGGQARADYAALHPGGTLGRKAREQPDS